MRIPSLLYAFVGRHAALLVIAFSSTIAIPQTITYFADGIEPGLGAVGFSSIAKGPDGNLWFTERSRNRIGRITPNGVITELTTQIRTGSGIRRGNQRTR